MWAYLKHFPDATAEEIAALRQWVKGGNNPYENGNGVYNDSCRLMDFINALRFWDDMYQEWLEDPEGFTERRLSFQDENPTDFKKPKDDSLPF